MHPNEPTMEVLVERKAELNRLEFTPEVEKKFKAIEAQIARRKAEDAVDNAE